MKTLLPLLLLLPFCCHAQQEATSSARGEQYYTATYEQAGGSFRVQRYREVGSVQQQQQAGRVVRADAQAASPSTPATDAYREQHYEVMAAAELIRFELVRSPRYHFDQSTYRTQDNGTAIVLRVIAETPETPDAQTETAVATQPAKRQTKLYPNPTAAPGNIRLETPDEASTFRLMDTQGRDVQLQAVSSDAFDVPLGQLSPGMYVYVVEGNTFRHTGSLMVR